MSRRKMMFLATAALSLSACGTEVDAPPTEADGSTKEPARPVTELSLTDYMVHLIEHNAFQVWDRQMYVSNADGSRTTEPTTEEEWEEAESFALTLVQLTYPLHRPALAWQQDGWDEGVTALRDAAREAAEAAERRDVAAWFDSGDRLNTACVDCHYAFAPHLESAP